jgi:hypothetical protein
MRICLTLQIQWIYLYLWVLKVKKEHNLCKICCGFLLICQSLFMHLLSHNSKADLESQDRQIRIRDDTPPFFVYLENKFKILGKLLFLYKEIKKKTLTSKCLYFLSLPCYDSFSRRKWKNMTCSPHSDLNTLSLRTFLSWGKDV